MEKKIRVFTKHLPENTESTKKLLERARNPEEKTCYTVYLLINTKGERYIGSSWRFMERMKEHVAGAEAGEK